MKLTKQTLKQIIKEELDAMMADGSSDMATDYHEELPPEVQKLVSMIKQKMNQ